MLNSLKNVIDEHSLDAIAMVPGANFRRLFGRDFHLMERPLVVIVPASGEPVAIVPNLELASFSHIKFPGKVFDWRDQDGFQQVFADAALALPQLQNAKRFGLEGQRMRAFEHMELQKAFPAAQFINAHTEISSLRLTKTADEISHLKKAIDISEKALEAILSQISVGMSEKHIEGLLVNSLFANGAEGLAFGPIVAAGDNSAQPHASARSGYEIKKGDALLFDFGAQYGGMNADITRTFFVGEVSDTDRAFYNTVLAANKAGLQASKPGTTAHGVDDAVQLVLEASPFAQFARHKTGHGLGLDVHEAPQIMRGNHTRLIEGMVFTVEPGLYDEGHIGVRIEDDVLVTKDGIDCLTHFSKTLRIIAMDK